MARSVKNQQKMVNSVVAWSVGLLGRRMHIATGRLLKVAGAGPGQSH